MKGLEFLYLAMFVIGFAGSAALVWWGRRRTAQKRDVDEIDLHHTPPATTTRASSFTASSTLTPAEPIPAVAKESGAVPIAELMFATRNEVGDRECPSCKRRFGETTVVCPYDATPLQSVSLRRRRTTRPAITGARRPTCPSCGRRYESAARYCYHDGTKLSSHSPPEVPIVRACRSCGFETVEEHGSCGCDSPEMMEIDPSRSDVKLPTIPMMHCRRCDHVAVGETHCPNDGELLYPVMNVSMNALPPVGIGPRRKICHKCGRKFSSSADYCAYDGSKLRHLN